MALLQLAGGMELGLIAVFEELHQTGQGAGILAIRRTTIALS